MTYTPLVFKHVRDNVRYLKGNYCEIYFKKNFFFTFDKSVRNSKNKSKGDGHKSVGVSGKYMLAMK